MSFIKPNTQGFESLSEITTSAGAADSNKIPKLTNNVYDESFFNITSSIPFYKTATDQATISGAAIVGDLVVQDGTSVSIGINTDSAKIDIIGVISAIDGTDVQISNARIMQVNPNGSTDPSKNVYLHTNGRITQTKPTTSGSWVCVIGRAINASGLIAFNPQTPILNP